METNRLFDFLVKQNTENPEQPFLSAKITTPNGKIWKDYSFKDTQQYADRMSQLLINLGLQRDDKIAIIAHNCPEWNFVDLGCLQIGAVNVPMYPNISEKDYEFIFNDAGIRYAFVGDEVIYKKVLPLLGRVNSLAGIYTFDKIAGVKNFEESLPHEPAAAEIAKRKAAVTEDDLATIIYTSGTSGNPKGVMLSHKNISSNIHSIEQLMPKVKGEKALSFLPLCHSFERMSFYAYLYAGLHIYYAENLDTIARDLKEVQPFCFTTVPRLFEKVYERIMENGNALKGYKRRLFFWSLNLGLQYQLGKNQGPWYNFRLWIARKLVFSKWREALGGHVKYVATGAAPMQPRLIKIFSAAGVVVLEGYGLTETSPVLCVNRIEEENRAISTVGLPLPGVTIKLADDGEILAKGDNVMKGYYNRPDLTTEAIDSGGWFHTGDIGEWVDGRFLKITDRKKELFKTSGGKYVAPQVIENKMKESHFIEQIMVVGESRKFVSALIVPSYINLRHWAKVNAIEVPVDNNKLVENPKIRDLINAEVERLNKDFGKWEQIRKFALMGEEWTIERSELTPTLKVKRKTILEHNKLQIAALYETEQ
jgi:long-chain acyl-CoA synthetase